ncbi:predicted protein [Histoplasma mississippiense (nom. inval.)]|uniref:predicted protein n=1 Tax=Ajellomyces capsulatus (strain NAm1 / WU24) TaxID=2059318 RepID=UPI000157C0CD|nr:predicted protein [Histoplasma mississippiense (nom. inval.)]EDN06895.1 predicted protein [Histoplasma mississippiense (nom. inval.)]
MTKRPYVQTDITYMPPGVHCVSRRPKFKARYPTDSAQPAEETRSILWVIVAFFSYFRLHGKSRVLKDGRIWKPLREGQAAQSTRA